MVAFHLFGIGIGLFMIAVAVFNWDWWFFDPESRIIEAIGGESMVRWYWAIGGVIMIVATVVNWIWGVQMWWGW